MPYALNVADLTHMADDFAMKLLLGIHLKETSTHVDVEKKKIDGIAVVMESKDESAQATIEIIRKRYPKTRAYKLIGKRWIKI